MRAAAASIRDVDATVLLRDGAADVVGSGPTQPSSTVCERREIRRRQHRSLTRPTQPPERALRAVALHEQPH